MTTVVSTPTAVRAVRYRRLIAHTLHIVQPDRSGPWPVGTSNYWTIVPNKTVTRLGRATEKLRYFTAKRHILAWIHVVWAILREDWLGVWPPGVGRKKSESHARLPPLTQGLRYSAAWERFRVRTPLILHRSSMKVA